MEISAVLGVEDSVPSSNSFRHLVASNPAYRIPRQLSAADCNTTLPFDVSETLMTKG